MERGLHRAVFLRSLLIQACWSYEGMQNLGFLYGLDPWLRRIYPDPEEYRRAAFRHLEFFNTQPYMAGFAFGVIGGLEERRARLPEEQRRAVEDQIVRMKKAMGSSLAAIGDTFFWGALKPACAGLILLSWLVFWSFGVSRPVLLGALLGLACFNAAALWVRWRGIRVGYATQERLPDEIQRLRWHERVRWVRRLGLAAALVLTVAALVVPPQGGSPGWWGPVLLAAAAGARAAGLSAVRSYGVALALGCVVALAGP